MFYMYTLIPQRDQIKLLFALRQAVSEIEPIFIYATFVTLKGQMWVWQHMSYMYTLIPQRPKLSSFLLYGKRFSRQFIFIYTILTWPWKVKCDFGSIDALYVYTYTPEAQIKLLFALRQAVFEIVYFYIRDLDMTLKGQIWFWQHRCPICIHLYSRDPN